MLDFEGRRYLVTGVLNEDSIAWHTAAALQEAGADVLLTGFGRSRRITEAAAASLPSPPEVLELDVTRPEDFTATSGDPIPHDKLVRFDNNVGQRNVYPKPSILGGQTKFPMKLNGGPAATDGAWELDATAMPPDTQITIRTLSRIIKPSTLTNIEATEAGDVRTTLQMKGGDSALVEGFRLDANDEVSADVTIDFSHEAVHMKAYDLVTTQLQDHEVAGRLTIEITAVKDLSEWFFGNRNTHEVHIQTCPYWDQISDHSKEPYPRIELALAHGYNGCAYCLPQHNTG